MNTSLTVSKVTKHLLSSFSMLGVAILMVAGFCTTASAQSEDRFVSDFVSNDAFLVIAGKPSLLLEGSDEIEEFQAVVEELNQETGLEMSKIDQVLIQFGDGQSDGFSEQQLAIVGHYSENIPVDRIVASEWGNSERTEFNGRPMFLSSSGNAPSIYLPSDQTIVFAETPRLRTIASSPMTMSPVVSNIRDSSPESQLLFLMNCRDMSESLLDELFGSIPPIGPLSVRELVSKVETIQLEANPPTDTPISAVIETGSVEDAASVEQGLGALLELGRTSFPILKASATGNAEFMSESEMEMAMSALDNFERILEGAQISTSDSDVLVEVKCDGGLDGMVYLLGALLLPQQVSVERQLEAEERAIRAIEIDRARARERKDDQ